MSPHASSILATSSCSGAVSLRMDPSSPSPSRVDMMAMPWSPTVPDTSTASPGRARSAEIRTPAGTMPRPLVLMKTLSPEPFPTTFVSPTTIVTPASAAASRMEETTRRRSLTASPPRG
jgi:hypothetical protein